MAEDAQAPIRSLIRYPLLLLGMADLVLLGLRLRPWQTLESLPGNGTTAFDPLICLCAYLFVILWLTGRTGSRLVSAQSSVTLLGLLSGALLAVRTWIAESPGAAQAGQFQGILLVAAVVGWGIAGVAASREAGLIGASLISGMWSAMVSALVASAVVLGQFFLVGPPPETHDSYRQFQEIGIGGPATIVLVNALTAATALLLLAPFAAGVVALIFGWLGQKRAR